MSTEPRPTNQSILMDITHRLSAIEAKLDVVSDHEERIRDLEKARYQTAWMTSIVSAVLTGGVVALVVKFIGA